jgi:hypothetical protein
MIEKDVSYQLNDVGVYTRLNVDQGLEDVRMHDWNQLGKVTSHTKQYLQSTSVTKLLGTVTEFLLEKQGIMSLNQLCEYLRCKIFIFSLMSSFLVRAKRINSQIKEPPAVSPYFTVRKDVWTVMEQKLTGPRVDGLNIFVISGMGGCGKTQMVSYFVQKHSARYALNLVQYDLLTIEASNISFLSTLVQIRISKPTCGMQFDRWMDTNSLPTKTLSPFFGARPTQY